MPATTRPDVPADAPASCPGTSSEDAGKADSCAGCPNQSACSDGSAAAAADADAAAVASRLGPSVVRHKLLVLSGKGGVGKSTIAAQLSYLLSTASDVGLLDVDVCGPSAPHLLGVSGEPVHMAASGWAPVPVSDSLSVMSVGFMLAAPDAPVIWRGARKTSLIKQFLRDVDWGPLDYLVVDAPPGTSDEHISVVQLLKAASIDGALIVTTPQEVALLDVRKEVNFCKQTGTKVIGVIENMAGFVCEHCNKCTNVFAPSSGGAERMCKEMGVPFLGSVPLDPRIASASELGKSLFEGESGKAQVSPAVTALRAIIDKIKTAVQQ